MSPSKKKPTKRVFSKAESELSEIWRIAHYMEYAEKAGDQATPAEIVKALEKDERAARSPEMLAAAIARIMAFNSFSNENNRTEFIKSITQNDWIECFYDDMPIPKQTLMEWNDMPVRKRRDFVESLLWNQYVSLYRRVMIDLSDILPTESTDTGDELLDKTLDSVYNPFLNSPSSPVTEALMRLLISHGDVKKLKERRKDVNHSQSVKIAAQNEGAKEGAARIVFSNNVSEVKIYLSDIDKISGNNKAARKMLTYALIKVNEQAYSNHALKRNFIQFEISDLVNAGLYSTPQSARVGFKNSAEILTSLKISGTLKKGKKEISQDAGEVLFTGWRAGTGDGSCILFINERISWDFVAAFYTILPRYCFRLPARSFDLLYYIFYQARQHYRDIEEKGYFTISMKAIQERLNLPDENSRNADRDIRQASESAITAIEDEGKDRNFTITPVYKEGSSISEYLNNGYIKVGMSGQYAAPFKELAHSKEKRTATAQKRRETITQKAIAINMAKKMEEQEQQKKEQEREQQEDEN